jgi:PHP family Zn ribbon phosphoesterase
MTLREFKVDLHIHTCLSPCGDFTMLPTAIVKQAQKQKLNVIGICDHNSSENVGGVKRAGQREGLQVIGGMEITSREEVHILVFFEDDNALHEMQRIVYDNLSGQNDGAYFGEQFIADEDDHITHANDKLLIGATELGVNEIVGMTHGRGGMAIASHVNRESYSLIGQLGFIPEKLPLAALELSLDHKSGKTAEYKNYGYPLVAFSDAHYLEDIGKSYTTCHINEFSLAEMEMALGDRQGRKVMF